MDFYIPAALPLLYYDDTLERCVDYLRKCDCELTQQEVSETTKIPIEICQAKIPEVLILNRYLIQNNEVMSCNPIFFISHVDLRCYIRLERISYRIL